MKTSYLIVAGIIIFFLMKKSNDKTETERKTGTNAPPHGGKLPEKAKDAYDDIKEEAEKEAKETADDFLDNLFDSDIFGSQTNQSNPQSKNVSKYYTQKEQTTGIASSPAGKITIKAPLANQPMYEAQANVDYKEDNTKFYSDKPNFTHG